MIDIKFIRNNPDIVKKACKNRQVKGVDIDQLLKIDEKRRGLMKSVEAAAAQKNAASKKIKETKEKKGLIKEMQTLDKKSDKMAKELKDLEEEFQNMMQHLPNIPLDDVPIGRDEKDNVVVREEGKRQKLDFNSKDYLEIAEKLDLIDIKRAAKVSGTRFGYLKNEGALLEFALVNLAIETLTPEGFIPIIPPVMIRSKMMEGMGYADTKEEKAERYFLEDDDLYLVGTSEQSIGPMHAEEVLEEKELPKRYVTFSTCFRREAGAYGKDTKGILRVHQFDKVEMFSFCKPEDSKKEHEFLLALEEKLMKTLNIPYRVVQLCTGDLARPSAATYDIESWLPGQNQYRETHSTSHCTDFQARRLSIRYRDSNTKGLEFVHTLNGTAFAIGRMIIAIIENYQQKDGSIVVPEALQKYVGFKKIPHNI